VPILAFFFLKDVNKFRLGVLRMFPAGRLRYRAELVMEDVNTTLAAYTRAQLISCFVIALICTLGFSIVGLKYALLLGILAGIFEFVPMLGPAAIGLIVILTAAFSDQPWKALYVAIFFGCPADRPGLRALSAYRTRRAESASAGNNTFGPRR